MLYINDVILGKGGVAKDDMMTGGRGGVQIGPKKDGIINVQLPRVTVVI